MLSFPWIHESNSSATTYEVAIGKGHKGDWNPQILRRIAKMIEDLANKLLDLATLRVIFLPILVYYVYVSFIARRKPQFPRHELFSQDGKQNKWNSLDNIMKQNYSKSRDYVYQVEQPHKDIVVIPAKYVDELKDLSEDKVDFLRDIDERFLGEYSRMLAPGGLRDKTSRNAVKHGLTPNLGAVLDELREEAEHAFHKEVGDCNQWTPITPSQAAVRIVALTFGRIFVGPGLNRNEVYLNNLVEFAAQNIKTAASMRRYPRWLRPIAEHWDPEVKHVDAMIEETGRLLSPMIKERLKPREMHLDLLAWAMAACIKGQADDTCWQAMYQLQIGTASVHVTSAAVTHLWFDLAARPENLSILREEIESAMAEEPNGVLHNTTLSKLKKLDSFMKESMRLHPYSVTGFTRKVMTDLKMNDGTVFPKGITVTTPLSCLSTDPEIYECPEKFDGLRFYKLRQEPGNEHKYQFVTTDKVMLNWGHGNHACPGRFFADVEIKIVMIYLIRNYDIKLPEGECQPANVWIDGAIGRDPSKQILFRSR